MRTWEPWPRSTRRETTGTTRNGGAPWRRNPFGSVGKTTRRKSLTKSLTRSSAGVAPWQKPWKPGEQISAENFSTGQKYNGGNSLYLMSRAIREGRGDNRWGTYNQIQRSGRAGPQGRERNAGFVLHGS